MNFFIRLCNLRQKKRLATLTLNRQPRELLRGNGDALNTFRYFTTLCPLLFHFQRQGPIGGCPYVAPALFRGRWKGPLWVGGNFHPCINWWWVYAYEMGLASSRGDCSGWAYVVAVVAYAAPAWRPWLVPTQQG